MSFWSNPGQSLSNAVSQVSNLVSSVGQSISDLGVQIDKGVNSVIPGGWAMIGAIALTAISLGSIDLEPEVLSAAGAEEAAAAGAGTGAATAGTAGASMTGTAGLGGSVGTGLTTGAGASAGLTAGSGALSTGVAGLGGAAGTGLTVGGIGAGATSALQAMAVAAGTGALYGGGAGGVNALIRGTDPLKGIVIGAVMGGLTAGAANGLTSALTASGVDSAVAPYMANALVGASKSVAQGADPLAVLENMALSSGLNALSSSAKSILNAEGANPVLSNIVANTGTGAIGSAVKGGDIGAGALSGAINSAASQTVGAVKGGLTDAYNTLTAPSASAAPSDPNAYGPVSPVQAGDPTALQSQYLTAQAQQLLEQGQALQPTIAQQQAELAAAGSKANDLYTQAASDKTAMYDAINNTYNPAYANVADLQGKAASMYSQVEALQKTYDDNKAAYNADSTNKTAFNTANDAANQLNTLIPQYNTAAQTFTAANTQLESLYASQIAPLIQTYQASNNALGDQLKTFVADQNALQDTTVKYSDIVNNLNTISTGNLVSGMNAPVVSMQAPSAAADSYYNQLVNAMSNPDAPPTTGSQTAGVTVEFPTMTDAGNGTNTPYVPTQAPTTPAVEDPSQTIVDRKVNPDGTITETMADGSTVVSDATTGEIISPTTTPANPDQAVQDQLLADAAANQQGTVGGTTGGTASVTNPTAPVDNTVPVTNPTAPVTNPTAPVDNTAPVTNPTAPVDNTAPVTNPTAPVDNTAPVTSPATGGSTAPAGGVVGGTTDGTVGGTPGGVIGGTTDGTVGGTPGGVVGGTTDGTSTPTPTPTPTTTGGGTSTGVAAGLTMAQILALLAANKGTTPVAATTPAASTITDLKPGLTKGSAFKFASEPKFTEQITAQPTQNPADYTQQIEKAAQGGLIQAFAEGGEVPETPAAPSPTLRPGFVHGSQFKPMFHHFGAQFAGYQPQQFAEGGDVEKHNPEFFSEGGLKSLDNTYVQGAGDGTSDSIPAMLANGEFVIPADVVSKLGNGSNDAGANVLDEFLATIRTHAQNHDPKKLPPESKGALAYLLQAKRKAG